MKVDAQSYDSYLAIHPTLNNSKRFTITYVPTLQSVLSNISTIDRATKVAEMISQIQGYDSITVETVGEFFKKNYDQLKKIRHFSVTGEYET